VLLYDSLFIHVNTPSIFEVSTSLLLKSGPINWSLWTTLTPTNQWLNIFTATPPTLITGSYTDLFGTNAMRFHRIQAPRP
jgi:hypothetical protein